MSNTYDLDKEYGDEFTACRRAKSLGLKKEHGDAYEAILEALLPEREETITSDGLVAPTGSFRRPSRGRFSSSSDCGFRRNSRMVLG